MGSLTVYIGSYFVLGPKGALPIAMVILIITSFYLPATILCALHVTAHFTSATTP